MGRPPPGSLVAGWRTPVAIYLSHVDDEPKWLECIIRLSKVGTGPVPMNSGDSYRRRAAELKDKSSREADEAVATELEQLARSYLRLAEQADTNSYQDIWAEFGPTIRMTRGSEGR